MKLTPYRKILGMTKEAITAGLAPLRANEMKKKAEFEMAKIDSKILELDHKIAEVSGQYPIDFDAMIAKLDDRGLLERKKLQFGKIIGEMFPE